MIALRELELTIRLLFEVVAIQGLLGGDSLLRVVGEQVVHQLQTGLGKEIELLLQIIVGLLLERERIEERQVHHSCSTKFGRDQEFRVRLFSVLNFESKLLVSIQNFRFAD